jgi:hypothetical protein
LAERFGVHQSTVSLIVSGKLRKRCFAVQKEG